MQIPPFTFQGPHLQPPTIYIVTLLVFNQAQPWVMAVFPSLWIQRGSVSMVKHTMAGARGPWNLKAMEDEETVSGLVSKCSLAFASQTL